MLHQRTRERIQVAGPGHRGYLSIEQISDGISRVIQNAFDLIEDGVVLLENGRAARALALALHGIEEVAKIDILASMVDISSKRQREIRSRWRQFHEHNYKSARGAIVAAEMMPPRSLSDLLLAAMESKIAAPNLERARQLALYVECAEQDRAWLSPVDIEPEEAAAVMGIARGVWDRAWQVASSGLYSVELLKLRHQMYSPFFDKLYSELPEEPTADDFKRVLPQILAKHREFFAQCKEENPKFDLSKLHILEDESA